MDTRANILQELKEHSLVLHQMKSENTQPFKVPESYFSGLQKEVLNASEIGLSDDIGKNAFKVPEHYFNQLSDTILSKIENGEKVAPTETARVVRVIELNQHRKRQKVRPFKIYAMVAAITGLFLFMTFLNDTIKKPDAVEVSFADMPSDYLEDTYEEIEQSNYALLDLSTQSIDLSMTDEYEKEFTVYLDEDLDENELTQLYNDI